MSDGAVINVKPDLTGLLNRVKLADNQIPFATALALTRTAVYTKGILTNEMSTVFDRPTPYTLHSLTTSPATKVRLVAQVRMKDFGKGAPPTAWLSPEIEGGPRNTKGFERLMQGAGILPSGWYAVPGDGAPLDGYGNVPGGVIVKILSQLQAFGESGYSMNETAALRAKRARKAEGRYFAVVPNRPPSDNLRPGIYERLGGAGRTNVSCIFIFTSKRPQYSARYPFYTLGNQTAADRFPIEFEAAAVRAMATAK